MPPKKKAARKTAKKAGKQKSFEETLWDTATKLRGSVESSDWSGATKTNRLDCPEGERGGAHHHGVAGFCKKVIQHASENAKLEDINNAYHIAA